MAESFIAEPAASQRSQALLAASRGGWAPAAGEDFGAFWTRIPVTDAGKTDPAALAGAGHGARILFSSGGSTGAPKYTELAFAEMLDNCAVHGRSYLAAGVRSSDVVAAWGLPGLMSSEFTVYLALAETGCCILPIGVTAVETIAELVAQFQASVLLVMPSDLIPLANLMESNGIRLPSVRLILTGGEALPPADEGRYRALFGDQVRFRSTFQTSEVGAIGYQCDGCGFGEYHVHDDLQLVEVIRDPGAGVGQLVTTNLRRQLVPVLRQRTGDLAEAIGSLCPCGDSAPRIRLRGRSGRFVNFGGEKFDVTVLSKLKDDLALRNDDFQLVLDRDEAGRDQFVLRSRQVCADAALQERIAGYFAGLSAKVADQLAHGVIADIRFAVLDAGELSFTVAGKVRYFVDHRVR
ncbi:MAG: AMP-binding protein [Actinomycetota bacterium]|nr:AMP-binding protein [Actinomycetota bacterium]